MFYTKCPELGCGVGDSGVLCPNVVKDDADLFGELEQRGPSVTSLLFSTGNKFKLGCSTRGVNDGDMTIIRLFLFPDPWKRCDADGDGGLGISTLIPSG